MSWPEWSQAAAVGGLNSWADSQVTGEMKVDMVLGRRSKRKGTRRIGVKIHAHFCFFSRGSDFACSFASASCKIVNAMRTNVLKDASAMNVKASYMITSSICSR